MENGNMAHGVDVNRLSNSIKTVFELHRESF